LTGEITVRNLSNCSEEIIITLDLPRDCRLSAVLLEERVKELFKEEILRDLCDGCPLEKK